MSPQAEDVALHFAVDMAKFAVDLANCADVCAIFCAACKQPIRAHAIFGTVCVCPEITDAELDQLERHLMTTFDNTKHVEEIMRKIDDTGSPPMPRLQWIDLLEQVISDCRARLEAAREEQREDDDTPEDFDPAD